MTRPRRTVEVTGVGEVVLVYRLERYRRRRRRLREKSANMYRNRRSTRTPTSDTVVYDNNVL